MGFRVSYIAEKTVRTVTDSFSWTFCAQDTIEGVGTFVLGEHRSGGAFEHRVAGPGMGLADDSGDGGVEARAGMLAVAHRDLAPSCVSW
jgi:hypothetical protein